MNKKQIEEKTEELLTPLVQAEGLLVYDVEYIKEAGEYFLRCYLDRAEGAVTIEDCVNVNRTLSSKLDEEDYISDSYTLEVSSKGLGRALTKDRHLAQEIGQSIDVKLYKARDGVKLFSGNLKCFDKENLTVETEMQDISFLRKDIASVKLTLEL